MSKAYGLAGLRLGWVATKNEEMLAKLIKMKHYTTICTSSTSEFLATVALKHGDDILQKNRLLIEKNLEISEAFFGKFSDLFLYNKPQAGPVAFHKLKIDIPVDDFVEKLVSDAGILLLSAAIYDYDGQYFRMGYGRADFEENLLKFEEYLVKEGY